MTDPHMQFLLPFLFKAENTALSYNALKHKREQLLNTKHKRNTKKETQNTKRHKAQKKTTTTVLWYNAEQNTKVFKI